MPFVVAVAVVTRENEPQAIESSITFPLGSCS